MDNDIFHKFTHKFIPITTIYDQLLNGPWAEKLNNDISRAILREQ